MNTDLTFEEHQAVASGESLADTRAHIALRTRIQKESDKFYESPVEEWPPISINWDTKKQSQCFSLDGLSEEEFNRHYPEGFLLGFVDLKDLDAILCNFSRRDEGELWEVGNQNSLAYLIVYLSEGRPISPPLVKPITSNEVIFNGGHHRYAIAKVIGETRIPIHVEPEYKEELDSRLNIEWLKVEPPYS